MSPTDDRPAGRARGGEPAMIPVTGADLAIGRQFNLLEILLDRMPMGVGIYDHNLSLIRSNPTWTAFLNRYSRLKGLTEPGIRLFDSASAVKDEPAWKRVLDGETIREDAIRLEDGGSVTFWDSVLTPLKGGGPVLGIVGVTIDVTARVTAYQTLEQRAEERLRETEHRHKVAESLGDILAALNSNRSLPELLGYIVNQASQMLAADAGAAFQIDQDRQMTSCDASDGFPPELAALVSKPLRSPAAATKALFNHGPMAIPDLPAYYADLDGDEASVRDTDYYRLLAEHYRSGLISPITIKDEVYGGLVFYYHDHRESTEEDLWLVATFADQVALALENARLREREELAAVMAERNRLARDLHDAVTQTLFAASLIADVLPRIWERNPPEGRRRLEELRQLTRGALAEMRTLLLELRPTALVEAPLGDLLKQLGEAITGRARVPVAVVVEESSTLPPDVQVALYRIAQEALNNVAKHARATQVTVLLRLSSGPISGVAPLGDEQDKARGELSKELRKELELRITDNGRGFAANAVSREHLGLGIMRERAASIGATLTVDSQPGLGTQVLAVWRGQTKEDKP
jgi:signal transduction histidine kinase